MTRTEVIKVKKVSELDELTSLKGYDDALLMLAINKGAFKPANYNIKVSNFINDIKVILKNETDTQEQICKEILQKSLEYLQLNGNDYLQYEKSISTVDNIPYMNIDTTLKLSSVVDDEGTISDGLITSKTLAKVLNDKWKII